MEVFCFLVVCWGDVLGIFGCCSRGVCVCLGFRIGSGLLILRDNNRGHCPGPSPVNTAVGPDPRTVVPLGVREVSMASPETNIATYVGTYLGRADGRACAYTYRRPRDPFGSRQRLLNAWDPPLSESALLRPRKGPGS